MQKLKLLRRGLTMYVKPTQQTQTLRLRLRLKLRHILACKSANIP